MASFPIPPDYSSYCEAMRRATHKWGAKEAFNRLKSLLLDGKLSAYASNRAGKLTRYPPNTWTFYSNDYLLSDPDERYPGMQTLYAATVFLTSELDEVFSVVEQQAEPRTASEPKASANSEQLQRGRPTKAGADEFWIEAARLVHEGQQGCAGKTQKNFIEAMEKWASANMIDAYSKNTIETKIKQFWRSLKLGGRN